jgi:hypothetical protein
MPHKPSSYGFLPTPQQELLLKVLLLDDADWPKHWQEWSHVVDIDTLDNGSYFLLPMLYKKLAQKGVNSPHANRLKGVYRKNWFRNHQLFNHAAPVMGSLHQAGIPMMLLKGAALILEVYSDFGLRSMRDIDLLVPTGQFREAISIMHRSGWRSAYTNYPEYGAMVDSYHALTFSDSSGFELDLHNHAFYLCMNKEADDDFWNHAAPVKIHDIPCQAMSPADQLLHVLVHGAMWNPLPPLRWVTDAIWLLKRHPDLDWSGLFRQAEKRQLVLQVRDTLDYLATVFAAPIPGDIPDRLNRIKIPRNILSEYKALIRQIGRASCRERV